MKYLFTLLAACCMMQVVAQSTFCNDWIKVTDSISRWNIVRLQHQQDTAFTKRMVAEKYKTITLLGKTPSSVISFVFWQIPMDSLSALQDCLRSWAAAKAFTIVQQPADAGGFSRVSIYADKKKQQRVALYDRYNLDSTRITVGLSVMWMGAAQ
jgi:hypothetical protein